MDTITNTILLSEICDAFELDQQMQLKSGKRKTKLTKNGLQKEINKRYPGGNTMSVRTGYSVGKKLKEDPNTPSSFLITYDNLERLAKTILSDFGAYDWPNVRRTIRESGPQYEALNKFLPKRVNPEKIEALKRRKLSDIVSMDASVEDALVEISKSYKSLIEEANNQKQELMQKDQLISSLSQKLDTLEKRQDFANKAAKVLEDFIKKNEGTSPAEKAKQLLKSLKKG